MVVSTSGYILGPTSQIMPVKEVAGRPLDPPIEPRVLNASVLLATQLKDKSVKFCSGTLIAGGGPGANLRVLTNHHCFASEDASGLAVPTLLPEACAKTKAHFGFIQGRTEQSTVIACQPGSLRTSFDGDVAVFTLAANPPDTYQPLSLWQGEAVPTGRSAMIIHYPDTPELMVPPPEGGPRLPTAQTTLANCKVVGDFPTNEWTLDRSLPFALRHSCDIIHGSSGSGLIDAQTSSILGVNWGGIQITTDGVVHTDNVSTRAAFIAAFLADTQKDMVKAANQTLADQQAASNNSGSGDALAQSHKVVTTAGKGCGVVAGMSGEQSAKHHWAELAAGTTLILGLAAPAFVRQRRRRR